MPAVRAHDGHLKQAAADPAPVRTGLRGHFTGQYIWNLPSWLKDLSTPSV
jgi:hypothetical protein